MRRSTHRPPYQYMLKQLKAARKAAGLTQGAVAEHLATTQTAISKIERGERTIDPVELAEFAALYNQELDYFLLKPTLQPPQSEGTVTLPASAMTTLNTLAYERGESTEQVIQHVLHVYSRSTD